MGDYKKDSAKGCSIDNLFPELKSIKENELLEEFKKSIRLEVVPPSVLNPPPYEFERIWNRIQEENGKMEKNCLHRENRP